MRDEHIVRINKESCTKCNLCVLDCPAGIIKLSNDGAEIVSQGCIKCGHCVAICPKKCIVITGFEEEPIEIDGETRINPEKFLMHMKARRSVRRFTDEKISRENIEMLIEAGQYSPTARNAQGVSYVVLQNNIATYEKIAVNIFVKIKKVVSKFTKVLDGIVVDEDYLFKKAPLVIVIKSTNKIDGALAASSMEIMAQSLGLGVFYSGMFSIVANNSPKLKKMLKIKGRDKVVTTLVIGHPKVKYQRTAPKEKPLVLED